MKPYTLILGRGERQGKRRGGGGRVDSLLIPKPSTINPKSSTLTLERYTLNTKPSPNPPPAILNPKTHTPNPKPSAEVNGESSAWK